MVSHHALSFWSIMNCIIMQNHNSPDNNSPDNKFMGSTWGPPGSCRPQMDPMLAPWTLLSGRLQDLAAEISALEFGASHWLLTGSLRIRPSTTMVLAIQDERVLAFHKEGFRSPVHTRLWQMIPHLLILWRESLYAVLCLWRDSLYVEIWSLYCNGAKAIVVDRPSLDIIRAQFIGIVYVSKHVRFNAMLMTVKWHLLIYNSSILKTILKYF